MRVSHTTSPLPLENPSQTEWGKNGGTVGLVLIGGVYLGIAPLLAGVKGSKYAGRKIYQFIRSHSFSLTPSLSSSRLRTMDKQHIQTAVSQSQSDLEDFLRAFDHKKLDEEKMNETTLQVKAKHKLRKQTKQALVSALSLIPVLGVVTAAAYLKATTPDIQDTGMHGAIEALAQHVFDGFHEQIQGAFYYLSGVTLAQLDQIYAQRAQEARDRLPANDPKKNEPIERHYYSDHLPNFIKQHFKAKETPIPVERNDGQAHLLQAYTYPADRKKLKNSSNNLNPSKPTVVIFHSNAVIASEMDDQARTYVDEGFNVVTVTMGGYPGSDEATQTSEASTYQDAHAVMNYLKSQGVKNVIVHGTSIGGSLAFAAAELHPDIVKMVIADQTFDRAKNVAANIIENIDHGFVMPSSFVRGIAGAAFPIGEVVPGVQTLDGKPYVTDGLNNVKKAASIQAEIIAIKSNCDAFMGRVGNGKKGYRENFADDLMRARYPQEILEGHLIQFKGEHCDWLDLEEQEVLIKQIKDRLNITS